VAGPEAVCNDDQDWLADLRQRIGRACSCRLFLTLLALALIIVGLVFPNVTPRSDVLRPDEKTDNTWKCVQGTCSSDTGSHRRVPYASPATCRAECEQAKGCTGYRACPGCTSKNDSTCLLWLKGTCDITTDNRWSWSGSPSYETCQLRNFAEVFGEWDPLFSLVGKELSYELQWGRMNSASTSTTETASTSFSAAPPAEMGGVGAEAKAEISHAYKTAWEQKTVEKFKVKFDEATEKNMYVWQWVFRTSSRAGPEVVTRTRELGVTRSKAETPKCLPGYQKVGTGYQQCQDDRWRIL